MTAEVPFYSLTHQHEQIREEVQQALNNTFDSDWYILGERVARFEKEYADYIGVKHCIGVGNGLDALKISLRALNIGPGDEVIVPANTYIATVLAVSAVGAVPVLVEPNEHTLNIDPRKIEKHITPKTKAILPVHLCGAPCDMNAIITLARHYSLFVVEDNAQATGALYKGKKTGSFGHVNAHSFYPTKNLGALGDGGAITTDDDEFAHRVRLLRNYGSSMKYHNQVQGYNSRLDEIQAAVLSIKLRFLDQWIAEKENLAISYKQSLSGLRHISLPVHEANQAHHLYIIQSKKRDALATYLKERGIQTLIHYPVPVYRQPAYAGQFDLQAYPITDRLTSQVLSLPLFPGMTAQQQKKVVLALSEFDR